MKLSKFLLVAVAACFISCGPERPIDDDFDDGKNDPVVDVPNNPGNDNNTDTPDEPLVPSSKLVGADLSQWLGYKNDNAVWKDNGVTITDLPQFFSDNGYNIARLRLFVNPDLSSTACQDLDYVIASARAMRDAGMSICLDFHYSDTWADPGKQYIPAEWQNLSATDLVEKVYTYTKETLNTLKNENIVPTHIQIGNEITAGMLWDAGRVSVWGDKYDTATQWNNFILMLSKASAACREVCPEAKVIVHIDRGGDVETSRRYYERIKDVDYDVIGLSYYPYWHGSLSQLSTTIRTLSANHADKEIMVVETGFGYNEWSDDSATADYGSYASTPEGQKQFLTALVSTLKQCNKVTGVFYWFPEETYIDWRSTYRIDLNRGLFNKDTGNALPAFYCLPEFAKE